MPLSPLPEVHFTYCNACYDNNLEAVKLAVANPELPLDSKAMGFYMACSNGFLDIVKYLEDKINLDESVRGPLWEYALQGASHNTKGKKNPVRDYILNEKKLVISESMDYWLRENNLKDVLGEIKKRDEGKENKKIKP